MTDQSYAVDIAHPPAALLRLVNPILRSLLHTPLAGPLRTQLMVVSFTGRKTGRHFSIPLSAHVIDNDLYALTEAGWKHNFSDGAAAQVSTTARRPLCVASSSGTVRSFLNFSCAPHRPMASSVANACWG